MGPEKYAKLSQPVIITEGVEPLKYTKSAAVVAVEKTKPSICKNCGVPCMYYPPVEKGDYCSKDCRYEQHSEIIKGSYTPNLRSVKRRIALERWKDKENRLEQSWKLRGIKRSEETKEKNSVALMTRSFTISKSKIIKERGCSCERCGKVLGNSSREKNFDLCIHHVDGCQWHNDPDNLLIVCRTCHSRLHNEISKMVKGWTGNATVANYIAKILVTLGVDLDHPDYKDTPLRVARCYAEMFEGYGKEAEVEDILKKWFPTDNDEMVVTGLRTHSLCPHHLLPVEYDIVFGYIPKGRAIGLSKIVRVCELLSKKPILQENLTTQITALFMGHLKPKGCAVTMTGQHSCMRIRGVQAESSEVVTSDLKGEFRQPEVRAEFFQLARMSRSVK